MHTQKFNGLTQACSDLSKVQNLPWGRGAMGKQQNGEVLPELLSDIALIFAMNAIWCYLWLRRRLWTEDGRVTSPTRWMYRLLISLTFLICILLLRVAWECFHFIMYRRSVLKNVCGGKVGEDVWGIGQVGAALAWLPLLAEMGYSAFQLLLARIAR
jgi:hypothetical protein